MAWYFPVLGYTITWNFGDWNDDHTYQHKGLDFGVIKGTPVAAVTDLTITETGYDELGYGNYIKGVTEDGLTVIFGHLEDILVTVGDVVGGGDQIGYSGNTGNSSGPHLHLEVRNTGGVPIDPMQFLEGGNEPAPGDPWTPDPANPSDPTQPGKTSPVGLPGTITSISKAVIALADFTKWVKEIPYKRIGGNITVILAGAILLGLGIYTIVQTQAAQALGSAIGSSMAENKSSDETTDKERGKEAIQEVKGTVTKAAVKAAVVS